MIEREVTIVNRLGLHARAAAKLVQTTGGFKSRVTLISDSEEIDGKSILGILLLAAAQGSRMIVRTEGVDEVEALNAIADLIANRFGEES
ncbi:MAG TPA: HPr family phosphocarrier protein [Thermoanaerobaculia bacterium]|jgi:phosphocarrier protein|nr:HPr family phosphocarrier protein [Thermoanaerobaculia bacterium]